MTEPGERPAADGAIPLLAIGEPTIPHQSYTAIFLRFLRFGFLAWGGPVAQIAMLKRELVDEEKWVDVGRFNRALAVYQVLPGPEAHELCVWFGMIARGRLGATLAGLGFMLPGFVLMFTLSWVYVRHGIASAWIASAFVAMQAAVVAVIVRAVHRIGSHILVDRGLWGLGVLAGIADSFGVHFALVLSFTGVANALVRRRRWIAAVVWALGCLAAALWLVHRGSDPAPLLGEQGSPRTPMQADLFLSGLRAGLLTFGGAYTVIPFLQHDAVSAGGWVTNAQFLDGLALSGMLPAPLIIFATFLGYLGGGPLGSILLTAGIFLPAFGFTLVGHELFERVTHDAWLRRFLDGIAAGVVGMIAMTAARLFRTGVTDLETAGIFGLALAALYAWKAKWAVAVVLAGAGAVGLLTGSP